jgi:hypothetical protein
MIKAIPQYASSSLACLRRDLPSAGHGQTTACRQARGVRSGAVNSRDSIHPRWGCDNAYPAIKLPTIVTSSHSDHASSGGKI